MQLDLPRSPCDLDLRSNFDFDLSNVIARIASLYVSMRIDEVVSKLLLYLFKHKIIIENYFA